MSGERKREGYLMLDHRAGAPGPSMRGPMTRRGLYESATVSCVHCQFIIVLRPDRTRERSRCFRCDRYICDGCGFLMKTKPCPGSYSDMLDKMWAKAIAASVVR